ncbi:translocation/assembly module TamB domain-containing protein [Methylophaga sp. UBA3996]|uniref:translocation/assembly module TamB domain-containing protein n=1 Tax=Methylophaga sp. UBA3996 TaxID=1946891 RepID=UPI0025A03DAC|nr:translocation/assembly module TamB domain-containing protein [Methylophaga sp. UBA3996]
MRKPILISVIVIFVAIILSMGWLLTTQSGLKASLNIVQTFVPALNVKEANGQLFGKLSLSDVRYQSEQGTAVQIKSVVLQWQPSALLKRQLFIQQVAVDGVILSTSEQSQETEQSSSDFTLPDIHLPLSIKLETLSVKNVTVAQTEASNTLLEDVQLELETIADDVIIKKLYIEREDGQLELKGRIGLTAEHAVDLAYQAQISDVLAETVIIDGNIDGNQQQLVLTQHVQQPVKSEQKLVVNDLTSSLHWILTVSADVVDVSQLVPEQPLELNKVKLHAKGTLSSMTSSLQLTAKQPELPAIDLAIQANTDDMADWDIELTASPDNEKIITVAGKVNTNTPDIAFDLKAVWQQLQWPLQGDDVLIKSEQGEVMLTGSLKYYEATLDTVTSYQNEPVAITAKLEGNDSSLEIEQLEMQGLGGNIDTAGHIDWSSTPITYDLEAHWRDITIPDSLSELAIDIREGRLSLAGNTSSMTLRSETDLSVNEVAMKVKASGDGQTDIGFEQSQLYVELGQGKVEYQGRLAWVGESLVNGELTLTQLNPGIIVPEWPGNLSGQVPLKVSQKNKQLAVELESLRLSGTLRQKPLAIEAKLRTQAEDVWIDTLKANSGDSQMSLNGQLQNDILDIDWTLSSPDLQDLYPGLQGQLSGEGELTGSVEQPRILAEINGQALAFETTKVETLSGNIDVSLQTNANINSHILVTGLMLSDQLINRIELAVQGKQQSHQIQLNVDSNMINLDLAADGQLNKEIWTGQFSQFSFGNEQAGVWQLREKGELQLSAQQQDIPRHCWQSEKGNLCLAAIHSQEQWQVSGEFADLPLTLFEPLAVELEQLQGQLKGRFSLAADKHNKMTGAGKISLENGSVQLNQSDLQQKQAVTLKNTFIEYQLDETQTTAQLHIEPQIEGVSAMNADIATASAEALMADPNQAALKGKITTHIADMSALQFSHPAIEGLQGELDVNIGISGTIEQPEIDGKAKLADGQVSVVDAGIIVKNIQADINGNLDKVQMTLTAESGEGQLNVTGEYVLQNSGWALTANVSGSQLEVMNTPEALVIAEPDMTITVTPEATKVTGKVSIPRAQIEPTRFNSSVSPSTDVKVISDTQTEQVSSSQTQLDITVSLGDKVQIKAMGFQGRLTGNLQVSGNPNDVILGNGQITIKDGSYIAYGQLLKVDNGKIRFSGPIDNPELDIKAVRETKEVTAGLYIEGNVSAPQATLFSDPDMSQDDILSYLILGKPIEQASATDAALLASAATGIGLQNGAMIGDDIANTFGLDEFAITGDSKENAALTIGKYLSPKLYLSYGIGVFDSVSSVELRYQLSKIWALKAESGTESGVDLLYTYEPSND